MGRGGGAAQLRVDGEPPGGAGGGGEGAPRAVGPERTESRPDEGLCSPGSVTRSVERFSTTSWEGADPKVTDARYREKVPAEDVVAKVVASFQPQRAATDCMPTCIKNVLDEFYGRSQAPKSPHRVPYRKISDACRWSPTNLLTTMSAEGLEKELIPLVAEARVVADWRDGRRSGFDWLQEVIVEAAASYPVLTLSPDYFDDDAVPYRTRSNAMPFYHSVVGLRADDESVLVYDPLARYKKTDGDPTDWIIKLPRVRFMQHWNNERFPREILWFRAREGDLGAY